MTTNADVTVSVVIPTKNAGAEFGQTLAALRRQPRPLEIVVVDSGSSDGTPDLAREHGARVVSIAPESFNHGETRNRGIRESSGQFCVMLVQDALPMGDAWLEEMLAAFADERVAGVTGRQVPRSDADRFARWQCDYRDRFLGRDTLVREVENREQFEKLDHDGRLRLAVFDNVFSVLRRESWDQFPFRPMPFAEDMDWAVKALTAGWRLVYEPSVCVVHSHARPAVYNLRRSYVSVRTIPQILHLPVVETNVRNDRDFLGQVGCLCGEARAILSEDGDSTEFLKSYDIAPSLLGSLLAAAGGAAIRQRCYPNDVRENFYWVLNQIVGSDFASVRRTELAAVVVKSLAEVVGGYTGAYYNWCEAENCVSDRLRRLGTVLSKGV